MRGQGSTPSNAVPRGGGALRGIGEKFAPDLHTGTGRFTVPLWMPQGRNGFQPALQLAYSSGHGNGPFGLGWTLDIPTITRKTSAGIPRYDSNDVFILSGVEDLVRLGDIQPITQYRPRTEGLFADIRRHHHSGAQDYWEVRTKDGATHVYGTPMAAGPDSAAIHDPLTPAKIFTWKLRQTRDTFGNRVEYEYEADGGDFEHASQLYLKQIRYVNYTAADGASQFLVTVDFTYEGRPDVLVDRRAGFAVRTARRCRSVIIHTHADRTRPIREFRLTYSNASPNGVSLLQRCDVLGFNEAGDAVQELPPLTFGHTAFDPEKRKFTPVTGGDLPPLAVIGGDVELVDLFGSGLADLLEMNGGSVRYWRNLGKGRFDKPRNMTDAPAGLAFSAEGVQLADADGDGRTDLMVTRPGLSGYFPLQFGGLWNRRSFRRYEHAPSFDLEDPNVRLMDLDGDGLLDALRSGTRLECFFNHRQHGWQSTRTLERRQLEQFPNVSFSDPRVRIADMTGDGLHDVVLISDRNVEYWPSCGYGQFAPRITMRNAPQLPFRYDPKRLLLGDVDGDGVADLVYVGNGSVTLWINCGGESWSEPITVQGTPLLADTGSVRLADIHGSGISGVLWSAQGSAFKGPELWFLDFTGGVKPYLLNEMDNHLGAITRVSYAPSTDFYLKDRLRRETAWRTPLPFPVQVVAQVEVIDAISRSKLSSEYHYRHGYWDGTEREFRGFGCVEQYDSESFERYHDVLAHTAQLPHALDRRHFSPPTCTRSWFHQGAVGEEWGEWSELDLTEEYWPGDQQLLGHAAGIEAFLSSFAPSSVGRRSKRDALRALRGRLLRTELYSLDGSPHEERPHTITEYAYALREESVPADAESARERIFFPRLRAERITHWERGDDPLTVVIFQDEYDSFGQARQQTRVALPRRSLRRHAITGANVGTILPDETRVLAGHTRTRFAQPEAGFYIHDRVAEVHDYELSDAQTVMETDPANIGAVLRDQIRTAIEIHELFRGQSPARLIGHTVHHYDGAAFQGLPAGQAGRFGALVRTETLVATDEQLDAAYGERRPAALDGPLAAAAGVPTAIATRHGYKSKNVDGRRHYYADTLSREYDFQVAGSGFGLAVSSRDPFGAQSREEFDPYRLLPVRLTDPLGLTTELHNDYRVLRPSRVTDPNGNLREYRFSANGFLEEIWTKGKSALLEGDRAHASEVFFTDLRAFERQGLPAYTHITRRVYHDTDVSVPLPERDQTVQSREYSDGFGRLIQKRAQAEDVALEALGVPHEAATLTSPAICASQGNSVVVSGWQFFDNKGRQVESYEPFFDQGWEFQADAKHGFATEHFYDSRGHAVRIRQPDGSETRVVYGIPSDLTKPASYAPTPWEAYAFDANDLAPLCRRDDGSSLAGSAPAAHHFTPQNTLINANGNIICAVSRNGLDSSEWFITRTSYDTRGNVLAVINGMGTPTVAYDYDLLDRKLAVRSADSGWKTTVIDAVGSPLEQRDAQGGAAFYLHDIAGRIAEVWAKDDEGQPITLRERVEYGDGSSASQSASERAAMRTLSMLGRPRRHFDEAGCIVFERYDLDGNVLAKSRRTITDTALLAGWTANWSAANADAALESRSYRTDFRFDALNRVRELQYPQTTPGIRARLLARYNRAGNLDEIKIDDALFVQRILHDAKGRRVFIAYGNGVMTRMVYEERSHRLQRIHSQRYTQPAALTYMPQGDVLQDLVHRYDAVGNVVGIIDSTPGSGIPGTLAGPDRLERLFELDPLYRLRSATGRECDAPPAWSAWDAQPRDSDITRARRYLQTYEYDAAGNVLLIKHSSFASNGAADVSQRTFTYAPESNRVQNVQAGAQPTGYAHDRRGNIIQETTSRHFVWNYADHLIGYRTQAPGAAPSLQARYLYDADGQRVKKLVRRGTQSEATVYIDRCYEHHRSGGIENYLLHIMDGERRIAEQRIGPAFPGDGAPDAPVRYHLGDHLDSSQLVIGGANAAAHQFLQREEYSPYGATTFGSFGRKRYRFAGKERDSESGLILMGARYYAPWLARWASTDPIGTMGGLNLYAAFDNNPLRYSDPSGAAPRGHGPQQAAGSEAHRDILPQLAFRLALKGYDVGFELQTLPGGSRRGTGRGEIDLVIKNREGGQIVAHIYDLKPQGAKGSYDWQVRRYSRKGVMLLSPGEPTQYKFGTILEKERFDKFVFADIAVPKPGNRIRIYSIQLAVDPRTGLVKPGFIDYTYRDVQRQPVAVPVTEKKKSDERERRAVPDFGGGTAPVPVPARTATTEPAQGGAAHKAAETVAERQEKIPPAEPSSTPTVSAPKLSPEQQRQAASTGFFTVAAGIMMYLAFGIWKTVMG